MKIITNNDDMVSAKKGGGKDKYVKEITICLQLILEQTMAFRKSYPFSNKGLGGEKRRE